MTELTTNERAVLRELSGDYGYSAADLAEKTGLTVKEVTVARKSLKARGFAEYSLLINEDDGMMKCSGYILTPAGADLCEAMERERVTNTCPGVTIRPAVIDTSPLHAIAAQSTREHGEPEQTIANVHKLMDGAVDYASSPAFFSPPPKRPGLLRRLLNRLTGAAA